MTLRVRLDPPPHSGGDTANFATGQVVRAGRGSDNDVVIGREQVRGQWTVSKSHVLLGSARVSTMLREASRGRPRVPS